MTSCFLMYYKYKYFTMLQFLIVVAKMDCYLHYQFRIVFFLFYFFMPDAFPDPPYLFRHYNAWFINSRILVAECLLDNLVSLINLDLKHRPANTFCSRQCYPLRQRAIPLSNLVFQFKFLHFSVERENQIMSSRAKTGDGG